MDKNEIRKGMVLKAGRLFVLVTSRKGVIDYQSFSGVVISSEGEERKIFPIGSYSNSWNCTCFSKTSINIHKIITVFN